MIYKFVRGLAIAALAAGTFAVTVSAATVAENRVATMKAQWANFKPITLVAKGKADYSMALVGNAEALVQLTKNIEILFPPGSTGKRTKPEIWSDWAAFVKGADALEKATPALVVAVKTGDIAKIGAAVKMVGKACGGCHKPFRAPKKK